MPSESLYLIFGDDDFRVSEQAKGLLREYFPDVAGPMPCDRIDGSVDRVEQAVTALRKTRMAIQSMGLFSEKRGVWLQDATCFGDSRTAQSPAVQDEIAELTQCLLTGLPPDVILIITAISVDKRRAFFKACKRVGHVHEFVVPSDSSGRDQDAARSRLDSLFKEQGLTCSEDAREAFLRKVGPDTRLILNEAGKLAVALGDRTRVDVSDVELFVSASREAQFWDLADAFASRDLTGCLRILRQLCFQGQNLIGVMVNLERRIRELLLYREAIDRKWLKPRNVYGKPGYAWDSLPPDVEAVFTGWMEKDPRAMHPYRVFILGRQASGFSRKRLEFCLTLVTKTHERMVSSNVPQDLLMALFLVRALGVSRRRVPKSAPSG